MKIAILISSFLFSWAYFGLIYFYLKGWLKTPSHNIRKNNVPDTKATIILPIRNEGEHVRRCIESLLTQDLTGHLFELIVVNDFSTDNTAEIIQDLAKTDKRVKLIFLKDHLDSSHAAIPNKKRAITIAVQKAANSTILTVDGDCEYPKYWLLSMLQYYNKTKKKLVTGPVTYLNVNNFWRRFLLMDLVSMMGITAGSIAQKKPVMANGANLLFEKDIFNEIEGYKGNEHIPSGDDVFLMQKISNKYPGSIGFVKDRAAMAGTYTPTSFRQFINQRIRWTSKSGKLADKKVTVILVLNYLFYLTVSMFLFVFPFYDLVFLGVGLVIFGVKLLVDAIFFGNLLTFFKRKDLLKTLLPMEILHLLYVTFMGLLAVFGTYKWKGRKVGK